MLSLFLSLPLVFLALNPVVAAEKSNLEINVILWLDTEDYLLPAGTVVWPYSLAPHATTVPSFFKATV